MKKAVIIVAGGSGTRMKSELPKQFIKWCNKPILMHTIERFIQFDNTIQIVLALPEQQFELWHQLCNTFEFNHPITLTKGGETRFHSVKNGLSLINNQMIVAIHDGVRPLVSNNTLYNCYATAQEKGNAIPVIDVFESIRQIKNNRNISVNRDAYKLVQTPQTFISDDIKAAYNCNFNQLFTDDASVYENQGGTINMIEGNRENIKITTPIDLKIGEALFSTINTH